MDIKVFILINILSMSPLINCFGTSFIECTNRKVANNRTQINLLTVKSSIHCAGFCSVESDCHGYYLVKSFQKAFSCSSLNLNVFILSCKDTYIIPAAGIDFYFKGKCLFMNLSFISWSFPLKFWRQIFHLLDTCFGSNLGSYLFRNPSDQTVSFTISTNGVSSGNKRYTFETSRQVLTSIDTTRLTPCCSLLFVYC